MKKILTISLLTLAISTSVSARPAIVGDIFGRDLAAPGMQYLGHVAVGYGISAGATTTRVMEVLNEPPNVVQVNSIDNFKSKSTYWGSRYIPGVTKDTASILGVVYDRAVGPGHICANYTYLWDFDAGSGSAGGSSGCMVTRCDTFVMKALEFEWPKVPAFKNFWNTKTYFPANVFDATPAKGDDWVENHGRGPLVLKASLNNTVVPLDHIKVTNVTPEEFQSYDQSGLDTVTLNTYTKDGVRPIPNMSFLTTAAASESTHTKPVDNFVEENKQIWRLYKSEKLDDYHRAYILDTLGFKGDSSFLVKFIDEYLITPYQQDRSYFIKNLHQLVVKYYEFMPEVVKQTVREFYESHLLDTGNAYQYMMFRGYVATHWPLTPEDKAIIYSSVASADMNEASKEDILNYMATFK